MSIQYESITKANLEVNTEIAQLKHPEIVYPEDPALCVLLDYQHQRAVTIHPTDSIQIANQKMKQHNDINF